jgi:hypothetical protein
MALGTNLGILAQLQSGLPPFTNTYSLDFDGVDDYVDTNSTKFSGASEFSISMWANFSSLSGNNPIVSNWVSGVTNYIVRYSSTKLQFYISTTGGVAKITEYTFTPTLGIWYNIICVYNGSNIIIYINGTQQGTPTAITGTVLANTNNCLIGERGTEHFSGIIDEVSYFDKALTPTEITSISAAPTDLTDLSPIAWYRMGDNGAYKSPQWLIPSDENKDKVSNYSYEFQGINSRQITVGTVNVGTTNTTSMWLKRNVLSTQQTLLGGSSATSPNYYMLLFTSNEFYVRYSPTVYLGWTQSNVTTIFNNTTDWINIVVVRSGNTVNLHLNGGAAIAPDISVGGAIGALDTQFTDIGADTGGINPTNGIINNIATWNVDTVLPSDIYNGGTPPDLTTLSTAPVNWWKMGEDATLVYAVNPNGAWTIPDNVGANDGTTLQTSTIFQRVGTAPNSENNAVSINMDLIDRVPDTPLTP